MRFPGFINPVFDQIGGGHMCGIVGYVGKGSCRSFVIEGLVRLEYRGYDSAGFACLDFKTGRMVSAKAAGSNVCILCLKPDPL